MFDRPDVRLSGDELYILVARIVGLTEAQIAEELTDSRCERWTRDRVAGVIRRCRARFAGYLQDDEMAA